MDNNTPPPDSPGEAGRRCLPFIPFMSTRYRGENTIFSPRAQISPRTSDVSSALPSTSARRPRPLLLSCQSRHVSITTRHLYNYLAITSRRLHKRRRTFNPRNRSSNFREAWCGLRSCISSTHKPLLKDSSSSSNPTSSSSSIHSSRHDLEALAEEFIELNGTERAQGMPNSPQAFQHAYNRLMQLHVHSDYMNREWFREFDPNGRKMILVISAGQLQFAQLGAGEDKFEIAGDMLLNPLLITFRRETDHPEFLPIEAAFIDCNPGQQVYPADTDLDRSLTAVLKISLVAMNRYGLLVDDVLCSGTVAKEALMRAIAGINRSNDPEGSYRPFVINHPASGLRWGAKLWNCKHLGMFVDRAPPEDKALILRTVTHMTGFALAGQDATEAQRKELAAAHYVTVHRLLPQRVQRRVLDFARAQPCK